MTSQALCFKPQAAPPRRGPRLQRGSMLLEAVVGVVVSGALGLGMAYSAARALNTQRYASTQTAAVLGMRSVVTAPSTTFASACAGSSLSVSSSTVTYSLTCSTATPTLTANSLSLSTSLSKPTSMATGANASLFGGSGVISFFQ